MRSDKTEIKIKKLLDIRNMKRKQKKTFKLCV